MRALVILLIMFFAAPLLLAASKDNERPDKEMLQMMDFLREMEMIRQLDMMKDMQNLENLGDGAKGANAPNNSPTKKKEEQNETVY